MSETLSAVEASGLRALLVYPCSDQGFQGVIDEIEKRRANPKISIHQNIPAAEFAGLLSYATALVGNSSAGLIEAPYFALPAVNIGDRQIGREHTSNVLHAPYDRAAISAALQKARFPTRRFATACGRSRRPLATARLTRASRKS